VIARSAANLCRCTHCRDLGNVLLDLVLPFRQAALVEPDRDEPAPPGAPASHLLDGEQHPSSFWWVDSLASLLRLKQARKARLPPVMAE